MELYNIENMPLSNDLKLRNAQQKVINGKNLTQAEKIILGRDHPIKEINGYKLKSYCVYRAISKELFNIYKEKGMIYGKNANDEYIEYEEDGKQFNNNKGVDWYLGGVSLRYGYIILECPAYKKYFIPAYDNGCRLSFDPTVRHFKSSGMKNPVHFNLVTRAFDIKENKVILENIIDISSKEFLINLRSKLDNYKSLPDDFKGKKR